MYIIIALWLFILLLIAILLKQLNVKKNFIICFLISVLIILFVLNMNSCMEAAIDGAKLVVKAILPTVLPFCVICNLLIYYDGINLYSKILGPLLCKPLGLSRNSSFPIAASFLCGYPLGAKYTCDIYKDGYINRSEFIKLSNVASNAGPIFLIGAVGSAMLHSTLYGYVLLISNYISVIILGIIFRGKNSTCNKLLPIKSTNSKIDFGDALKNSIDNAVQTTFNVAAYVIIFSIFISILKNNEYVIIIINDIEQLFSLPHNSLIGFILGSIEITNGAKIISDLTLNLPLKLSIISFLCSFSGLSIIAQVSSFFSEHRLPMKKYISKKFFQGIISFLITYLITSLFLPTSINTSTSNTNYSYSSFFTFNISILAFFLITLIITIVKNKINYKIKNKE